MMDCTFCVATEEDADFCDGRLKSETFDHKGHYLQLDVDNFLLAFQSSTNCDSYSINYCPMCGRKLTL